MPIAQLKTFRNWIRNASEVVGMIGAEVTDAPAETPSPPQTTISDAALVSQEGTDWSPLPAADLCAEIDRSFPYWDHDSRLQILEKVMSTIGRYYRENGKAFLDGFPAVERHGLHLLPCGFYSPIATLDEVPRDQSKPLIGEDFGLDLDLPKQITGFDKMIVPWLGDLSDILCEDPKNDGVYFWLNGMFGPQDAAVYYGVLRNCKAKKVIEVGSGFSTLIAARAKAMSGNLEIVSIEPYPVEFFSRHLRSEKGFTLIEKRVQDMDAEFFECLVENDILFIDSSHVVKPASDVEFLLFKVLPRLRKGVLVHFHDIFLPFGYPPAFYRSQYRHWNENYILAAYLAHNPNFEIVLANNFLSSHSRGAALDRLCQGLSPDDSAKRMILRNNCGGGSLWLRKR